MRRERMFRGAGVSTCDWLSAHRIPCVREKRGYSDAGGDRYHCQLVGTGRGL